MVCSLFFGNITDVRPKKMHKIKVCPFPLENSHPTELVTESYYVFLFNRTWPWGCCPTRRHLEGCIGDHLVLWCRWVLTVSSFGQRLWRPDSYSSTVCTSHDGCWCTPDYLTPSPIAVCSRSGWDYSKQVCQHKARCQTQSPKQLHPQSSRHTQGCHQCEQWRWRYHGACRGQLWVHQGHGRRGQSGVSPTLSFCTVFSLTFQAINFKP